MAKIDQNVMKQWRDGETIHAVEYNNERNLILAAFNDTQEQVDTIKNTASVKTSMIQNSAVTTDKLANSSVTTNKIADRSIDSSKLADGSVVTTKIANESVSSSKLAIRAVTPDKIVKESVTQFSYDKNETDTRIANAIAGGVPQATIDQIKTKVTKDVSDIVAALGNTSVLPAGMGLAEAYVAVDKALYTHKNNADVHVTAQEKTAWNAKETPEGAQAKVDALGATVTAQLAKTASNINLNIIDMAVELETLKGATLNGVTANIFIETFNNLNDINLMNGIYDSANKRLVL